VAAQIDAVVTDIGVDAAKTGMIANAEIIRVVAAKVREHGISKLVVDPVMVATSGDRLLHEEAVEALRSDLLPLATVVTPNLPEAGVLIGREVSALDEMRDAARAIVDLGVKSVLVKGGHLDGDAVDVFFDGDRFVELRAPRIDTTSTHGTGCTLASAIASLLARGTPLEQAIRDAKAYVTAAIEKAYPIGQGHGPVHHFYQWW
jgi:hydroxymethylpyrimidine/phosphomethylpyrimidine kinase